MFIYVHNIYIYILIINFCFFNLVHRPNLTNDIEEDSEHESPLESLNPQNYDDIPEDCPLVSERAGHGDHSVRNKF